MNRVSILSLIFCCCSAGLVQGQKETYTTSGGEWIFSWASAQKNGLDINTITRFSPVLNIQHLVHHDVSERAGFFSGLNLRNLGFIWDDPVQPATKHKARAYTLGIPIGFKIGNMKGTHLFGGYELELPFNYKEKDFVNEDKVRRDVYWFSKRIPGLYQSLLAGIQFRCGAQLKFKYYLTNFFNKNYTANDGSGNIVHPYQGFDANVFYVSMSFQILKGHHFYYSREKTMASRK